MYVNKWTGHGQVINVRMLEKMSKVMFNIEISISFFIRIFF